MGESWRGNRMADGRRARKGKMWSKGMRGHWGRKSVGGWGGSRARGVQGSVYLR